MGAADSCGRATKSPWQWHWHFSIGPLALEYQAQTPFTRVKAGTYPNACHTRVLLPSGEAITGAQHAEVFILLENKTVRYTCTYLRVLDFDQIVPFVSNVHRDNESPGELGFFSGIPITYSLASISLDRSEVRTDLSDESFKQKKCRAKKTEKNSLLAIWSWPMTIDH